MEENISGLCHIFAIPPVDLFACRHVHLSFGPIEFLTRHDQDDAFARVDISDVVALVSAHETVERSAIAGLAISRPRLGHSDIAFSDFCDVRPLHRHVDERAARLNDDESFFVGARPLTPRPSRPISPNSTVLQTGMCFHVSGDFPQASSCTLHMQKGGRVEGHLYYPRIPLETLAMYVTRAGSESIRDVLAEVIIVTVSNDRSFVKTVAQAADLQKNSMSREIVYRPRLLI